jgi:DNA adenine methylase
LVTSPLRFPGSKSKVLGKLNNFINTYHEEYREPFLGGASIFLGKKKSQVNWLNDRDSLVSNFFTVVRDNPIDLCITIQQRGAPTLDRWLEYRNSPLPNDDVEKAYRFLFFNRTNYSGIYKSNPIGGINQKSAWKIDCRWNSELLCKRIIESSSKFKEVKITNDDFEKLITAPGENVLLMLDPPYYEKGSQLYPVCMTHNDHVRLRNALECTSHKFILTIDDCPAIRELYSNKGLYIYEATWKYTVNSKKKDNNGKELFISNYLTENNSDKLALKKV